MGELWAQAEWQFCCGQSRALSMAGSPVSQTTLTLELSSLKHAPSVRRRVRWLDGGHGVTVHVQVTWRHWGPRPPAVGRETDVRSVRAAFASDDHGSV